MSGDEDDLGREGLVALERIMERQFVRAPVIQYAAILADAVYRARDIVNDGHATKADALAMLQKLATSNGITGKEFDDALQRRQSVLFTRDGLRFTAGWMGQ